MRVDSPRPPFALLQIDEENALVYLLLQIDEENAPTSLALFRFSR
jgi:hypothetical protein